MAQTQAIVTAQGDPLEREGRCILSLDGGGVRGLSSLLIIKALMAKVNAERKKDGQDAVKPCELFDLIGGTSTGGIIAIMLGRLEMDVDDCIKEYTSMFEVIFAQKGLTVTLWGKLKGRFDSTVLEQCVRKILKERGLSEHEPLNDGTERCKVVVCAKAFEITTTILLRSYNSDDVLNDTSATICEAVRATSAATSFFEPVTIGPRGRKYVDGGLGGTNNPVEQLWNEAQNIWCHDSELELSTLLKCFISIGTGDPGRKPIAEGLFGFFLKTLVDLATQTEDTAKTFVDRHRRLYEKKRYFRFNVQQGLQDVGLEEYKKAGLIEAATAGYMDGQETRSSVQACAINLKQKHFLHQFSPNVIVKWNKAQAWSAYHTDGNPRLNLRLFKGGNQPNTKFIGCQEILEDIKQAVHGDRPDGTTKVCVIHGMGGAGKSSIARQFALLNRKDFPGIVWLMNARSTATLEADFLELAEHFQLNIDHTKPEIIRRIVIKWFETQSCHRLRWLLILDGADDESFNLSDYFPPDSDNFGTVIITSRFSSSGRYHNLNRKCFEVNSMSDEDAKSLLIKTSDLDSDSWNDQPSSEDAQRLIRMLENLPLAIVQAGAWISGNTTLDPRQRLSRYIKLFNNHASRKKRGVLKVCWVTFELNINAIKEREPSWEGEVLQLFEFLTFLDQSGVSEFFFEATWDNLVRREFRKTELRGSKLSSYTKGQQLEVFSEIFSGVFDKSTTPKFEDEDHRVRKALKLLQRYGLVNLTFDTNSGKFLCLMHPIVHACSRDFMFPEDVKEIELRACLTLGASITWRYETKHRNVRRELLPHLDKFILALTSRKSELLEKLPRMEYYDLLLKFAKAYSEGGRFKEAEKLQSIVCNQLPPLKERSHDAQQPYSTSYTLLSQLFEFAIIFLWSSAPIIIALVSTLNYTEWIDYSQLELQRRKDQRNVHLMALKAWRELSNSEHDTDRPQGRQSALHHRELIVAEYETIQEYVKFLGVFDDDDREELERHIVDELCVSKMCLADSYSSMENRESTALELRQEVLETQKKRDPKAPERILEAMARTAQSHAKLRQTKEAIQMQKEILRARFKDDENFSTHNKVPCPEISHDQKPFGMGRNLIDAISNIAESFDASSELLLALDLRKEVLMEMKNIESEDHPDVLAAKTNLAITFEKLGFNESSMILRCQVHESWRTKAGDSHPRTLNAQLHRAKSFMKNSGSDSIPDIPSKQGGKEDETKQQGLAMAHEILTSVIAAYEKEPELYDEKDLQTAKSFLADCFSAQGDKAQALNLREQIYQFFHKTQGENARRTLEARDRFVNTYYSLARVTTKYPERQSYYTKAVIERIKLIEVQSGAGALHQWALPISWSRLADIYAKLADEADERNFLNETDSDDDYDNDNSSDNDDDIGIQLARVGEYQKTSTTSFKDSELSTLDADIETRDSPGSHRDCPDPGSFPQEGIFDRKGYELREHALRLYEYVVGELEGFDNEHQASTMARLAETLLATDLDENDIKAIELFRKAIKLRTRLVGASHSDTEALQRGLRSALASHNDGRSAFSNLEEVVDASRTKVDDFAALRSLGHFKRCGQHFSELLELGTGTV